MAKLSVLLLLAVGLFSAIGLEAGEAGDAALLESHDHWRYFMVTGTLMVRDEDGNVEPMKVVGGGGRAPREWGVTEFAHSELPPGGWRDGDFDDDRWPRRRLALMGTRQRIHSLLCARTQFRVGDPDELGDVTLSLVYRGGVAVYLNGEEIARGHLPDGELSPHAMAEDYPKEAYVDPDGYVLRKGWRDPQRYEDRFAKRVRNLRDVVVPNDKLRAGVNTLAIEVYRPPTDIVLLTGETRQHRRDQWCPWVMLGLKDVTLAASNADGLADPLSGLHVQNVSTLTRIYHDDQGEPHRPTKPVRLTGARNGVFSAQVLVSAPGTINGLEVGVSDLESPAGTISAEAVSVRYSLPDGPARERGGPGTFQALAKQPPETIAPHQGADRAAQPVWITVRIPEDANPGDYRGQLTFDAEGLDPVKVPVHLSAVGWTLPAPVNFASLFELVQSPESVALQYDVPLWSERHWELIARSFELMGELGSQTVYIPIFRQSCFGNEHSMIRWVRDADGWTHDFSIFERYIDTALEGLGNLKIVGIHTWPRTSGGAYFGRADREQESRPYPFSILDPETGELTAAEGPKWEDDDALDFFKPVFDGIRARLEEREVADALMVGIAHDIIPSEACVEMLAEASGGAPWIMHCHPRRWTCQGQPVGYLAYVWGTRGPSLDRDRLYGWQVDRYYTTFPRYGSGTVGRLRDNSPLMQYRVAVESAFCAGLRGYGWIGADFWRVIEARPRKAIVFDRYPEYDQRGNLGIHHAFHKLLSPGPDGALATDRFEMVREGLQESEARAFIERALLDGAKRARLGDELAERSQRILDDRLRNIINARQYWDTLVWRDWQQQAVELYRLAAEVADRLE